MTLLHYQNEGGLPYFQWGARGKRYYYRPRHPEEMQAARAAAIQDGHAKSAARRSGSGRRKETDSYGRDWTVNHSSGSYQSPN
jgi:hypothetical protein